MGTAQAASFPQKDRAMESFTLVKKCHFLPHFTSLYIFFPNHFSSRQAPIIAYLQTHPQCPSPSLTSVLKSRSEPCPSHMDIK